MTDTPKDLLEEALARERERASQALEAGCAAEEEYIAAMARASKREDRRLWLWFSLAALLWFSVVSGAAVWVRGCVR